jgi:hypothetical protein
MPKMDNQISLKKYLEKVIELNDRRYTDVNIEKEKALKIKEEADKVALSLARDIQVYKDEKANELREQINNERGIYVTRSEMKPLVDYVSSQQGRATGFGSAKDYIMTALSILLGLIAIYGFIT